jgi:hypothetical protein
MHHRHVADPAHGRGRRVAVIVGVAVLVLGLAGGGALAARRLLGGASRAGATPVLTTAAAALGAAVTPPAGAGNFAAAPGTTQATTASGTPSTTATPTDDGEGADAAGLTAADRTAGLLGTTVAQHGGGRLVVVPGSMPAPGSGPVKRVRVEVEAGLPIDGAVFAAFVLQTLNDPRSWGHGGRMTFARTSGAYDIRVVLASPDTSAALCAPLQTMGTLSCGQGSTAVLTLYRWVKAIPDYGTDRTGYRHYVVNHEVGHTLGHGHEMCPGAGKVAPVMMQQTKGLMGCLPNSWPFP